MEIPHQRMPECIGLLIESEGPGGAEYVVLNLAESLRARGHRVAPITLTHSREPLWIEAQFRDRGFDVDRAVVGPTIDPACLWHLRGVLKARGVDIVNSHEFGPAIYGTTASKLLGLPHVITMHGNMWVMQARRRRVALRWAIRASRATIAVSRDTHRHMTDQMGLGEREITTVLNGVPERVGERGVVRHEFGVPDGDVLIVAVGNLIERKGHAVLVRALAAIRSRRPDVPWRLLIAGEGVERPALEALVREHALEDRVLLPGHRSDIPQVLAAADIFTMPSFWEGLPLAVLEAMFCGVPIVASAISGIPEAVDDGRAGLLVPPNDVAALADALERPLTDAALRRQFGDAARARARALFTMDAMTDRYLALFRGQSMPTS